MKRPEEILESNLATQYMNSGFKKQIVRAMEEYAKAYANDLAESYGDLNRAYELEREHTISLVEQLELVTAMNNENERLIQRLQKTRDRLYALLTKHKIEIPQ